MLLGKIFWRRYRCEACSRTFELPINDVTLPPHSPRFARDEGSLCDGHIGILG